RKGDAVNLRELAEAASETWPLEDDAALAFAAACSPERILALLDGGGHTAYQLAQSLWPALLPLNIFLALSEVIGNLDVLEDEGRVVQVPRDGRILYTRP
ncbi:MAG: hypothetical protein Q7U96_02595, partial [Chloroflexota bacterium]|nr:hypothetical protein [Chloroflexota bacterium]